MYVIRYLIVFLVIYVHKVLSVAKVPLQFIDNRASNYGLIHPHKMVIVEGHHVLMAMTKFLVNHEHCKVTTPLGVTFDIKAPPSDRYEKFTGHCGIRIKNVTHSDEGRWRFTTIVGESSLTGFGEIHVQSNPTFQPNETISLHDGITNDSVSLSTVPTSYCMVTLPFTDSTLNPGHCEVTLDKTTRAVQGSWAVALGIPGRITELSLEKQVLVKAEHLDVGYVHDTAKNKLHLHCDLKNTEKNITFCRFQKTSATTGYNMFDGASDGLHSYFGNGFSQKHCGMTLETPNADDFAAWRCSVGVTEWVGGKVVEGTPLQALITASQMSASGRVTRRAMSQPDTLRKVLTQRDTLMTLSCSSEQALQYCWFQDPTGRQYTPLPLTDSEQEYWYSGTGLLTGDCTISFAHAIDNYTGLWTCHMGPTNTLGIENTEQLQVKVTGALAAVDDQVSATLGGRVDVYCRSANRRRPLEYCRFLSPSSIGMNIDETVTEENAILDRYFFTAGKKLASGDCSMTISPVLEEDLGQWSCAALLADETAEARDTVIVFDERGNLPRSQAGMAAGVAVGSISLLVIVLGFTWYRKGRQFWQKNTTSSIEMTNMDGMSNYSGDTIQSGSSTSELRA